MKYYHAPLTSALSMRLDSSFMLGKLRTPDGLETSRTGRARILPGRFTEIKDKGSGWLRGAQVLQDVRPRQESGLCSSQASPVLLQAGPGCSCTTSTGCSFFSTSPWRKPLLDARTARIGAQGPAQQQTDIAIDARHCPAWLLVKLISTAARLEPSRLTTLEQRAELELRAIHVRCQTTRICTASIGCRGIS